MTEIELLLMEKLAAKETPADTDTMIVAEGNVLKKSTISQLVTFLKEKLGINSLNTKLNDLIIIKSYKMTVTGTTSYAGTDTNLAVDGYVPIAIAGFQTSGSDIYVTKCIISGNWFYGMLVKNYYSGGNWTGSLDIKVAYIKNLS